MNKTFRLLFEQSGKFKDVLKNYGYDAFDYDIENTYNKTDYICDVFNEIDKEYENLIKGSSLKTIFTDMHSERDFVIAFFPCTHFSGLNKFQYKLLIAGKKRELNEDSVERLLKRNTERAKFFNIFLKFVYIMKTKGIATIIENPASSSGNFSYLELFSPIDVAYKEKDRSLFGDDYKKPTNYYTINFEMNEKFSMYAPRGKKKTILNENGGMLKRSIINKEYIENFYKRFLEGRV